VGHLSLKLGGQAQGAEHLTMRKRSGTSAAGKVQARAAPGDTALLATAMLKAGEGVWHCRLRLKHLLIMKAMHSDYWHSLHAFNSSVAMVVHV
jgi:hypothetical protein